MNIYEVRPLTFVGTKDTIDDAIEFSSCERRSYWITRKCWVDIIFLPQISVACLSYEEVIIKFIRKMYWTLWSFCTCILCLWSRRQCRYCRQWFKLIFNCHMVGKLLVGSYVGNIFLIVGGIKCTNKTFLDKTFEHLCPVLVIFLREWTCLFLDCFVNFKSTNTRHWISDSNWIRSHFELLL